MPGLRFLLDEDLPPDVAVICQGQGLDVLTVHALGRTGLSDEEQLRFAATQGRVLVTRNRDDFIRLTHMVFSTNRPHAGILVVSRGLPNNRASTIAQALHRWAARYVGETPGEGFLDFVGTA